MISAWLLFKVADVFPPTRMELCNPVEATRADKVCFSLIPLKVILLAQFFLNRNKETTTHVTVVPSVIPMLRIDGFLVVNKIVMNGG